MLFGDAQLSEPLSDPPIVLDAVNSSTESAIEAGFLLPVDAALIVADAETSNIGGS